MPLVGDWDKVVDYLTHLPDRLVDAGFTIRHEVHLATAEAAKADIRANKIKPPSQKSGTTLIETGEYVEAIGVQRYAGVEYVGLPPRGVHRASGMTWIEIYKVLRYGTANIPARKHIEPSMGAVARRIVPKLLKKMGFKYPSRG